MHCFLKGCGLGKGEGGGGRGEGAKLIEYETKGARSSRCVYKPTNLHNLGGPGGMPPREICILGLLASLLVK